MQKTSYSAGIRIGFLTIWMVCSVGCGAVRVQRLENLASLPERPAEIPQILADFLEFERSAHRGGDVILVGNLAEEEIVEDDSIVEESDAAIVAVTTPVERPKTEIECSYEAELAGNVWLAMPEPELIEDPLIEDDCIESAHSWCDPAIENIYLTHLELEKTLQAEVSIMPNFIAPVEDGVLLRGMQAPQKKKRGHYGIDIIPMSREGRGTPIKAVEDGLVVFSGSTSGYGYNAIVYHQNGVFSLYSHMLKDQLIKAGQMVRQGDLVGLMGKTGNARGYHLHFELIDLREAWTFPKELDLVINEIKIGCVSKQELNELCKVLFSRPVKQDPLQYLPAIALARKASGTWVALPSEQTRSESQESGKTTPKVGKTPASTPAKTAVSTKAKAKTTTGK